MKWFTNNIMFLSVSKLSGIYLYIHFIPKYRFCIFWSHLGLGRYFNNRLGWYIDKKW